MIELTKITPVERYFLISWIPHIRCNYDCMYCPDYRHNDDSPMPDFDTMCRQWEQIYKKTRHRELPYKISFSGGETTINKDFVPFIEWLSANYGDKIKQIGVSTNGSASVAYYLRLMDKITSLNFSSHTEYMADDFLDKVNTLSQYAKKFPGKIAFLNIMQEYWATDKIKEIIEFCRANDVPHSVSKIVYRLSGTRHWPIFKLNGKTEERQDLKLTHRAVEHNNQEIDPLIDLEDKYYNIEMHHRDGTKQLTFASKLRFLDIHQFQGWKCHAGLDRIFVLPDTSVHSGECENDYMGRLDDNSFELFSEPQPCKRKRCTNNPDDLQIIKYRE